MAEGSLGFAELMRGFWARCFSRISVERRGEAGAAQHLRGVSGCPHLPGAQGGGAGHGAQAGATAPWRPEPRGTALAMERGPPANGAGVRYSTQLQVRAHLGRGAPRTPASLWPRCLVLCSSGSFKPGGFRAALDPSGRGDSSSPLGKVRRTCLGDVAELSRAEKNQLWGSGDHLSVLALGLLGVGAAVAPGVLVSA